MYLTFMTSPVLICEHMFFVLYIYYINQLLILFKQNKMGSQVLVLVSQQLRSKNIDVFVLLSKWLVLNIIFMMVLKF